MGTDVAVTDETLMVGSMSATALTDRLAEVAAASTDWQVARLGPHSIRIVTAVRRLLRTRTLECAVDVIPSGHTLAVAIRGTLPTDTANSMRSTIASFQRGETMLTSPVVHPVSVTSLIDQPPVALDVTSPPLFPPARDTPRFDQFDPPVVEAPGPVDEPFDDLDRTVARPAAAAASRAFGRPRVRVGSGAFQDIGSCTLIGRGPVATGGETVAHLITVDDVAISKTHVAIGEVDDVTVWIEDRGSTNGTRVIGATPVQLTGRQRQLFRAPVTIEIGDTQLEIESTA